MNDATKVKQFTEEALGSECPKTPRALSYDQVMFLTRMVVSELDELVATVTSNEDEKEAFMQQALSTRDLCSQHRYDDDLHLIAAQGDALVDAWYYSLNVASKHGINLSKIFDEVHDANMRKRNPTTGKFERRPSDNKVLKPEGWTPPNVEGVIFSQMTDGSWE